MDIPGRAYTPEQKRQVLDRIYRAWLGAPTQRLGQLILNARRPEQPCAEVFYREDEDLVRDIEAFVRQP